MYSMRFFPHSWWIYWQVLSSSRLRASFWAGQTWLTSLTLGVDGSSVDVGPPMPTEGQQVRN